MNLEAEQFAELVLALNMPNVDPNATGRRRAIRAKVSAELLIEPMADEPAAPALPPLTVRVLDLSCGGIAVASPRPLESDSSFLIRLRYKSVNTIHIIARVAHCKPARDGEFQIGAAFTGVIAPDEESASARAGIAEQILDAMPQ